MSEEQQPQCPRTKFPDGTRCGDYHWHAKDCPVRVAHENRTGKDEPYFDRRARQYEEHDAEMKRRAAAPETEAEYAEVLNREDDGLEPEQHWNTVHHEVVVRFAWADTSMYTEGAMESIELVEEDPIGAAIDAYLQPMYDDDKFFVVSKSHRTEYLDEDDG